MLKPFDTGLKVAVVLTELRPGGMERVVVHLTQGLAQRGVGVSVFCLGAQGLLASELQETFVKVVALESHSGKDLRALWRLRKELIYFSPNVINVHDYASLPYVIGANLLGKRVPVLFSAHGLLYEGFEPLQRRNRFFARGITAFSAVSEKVTNRHQQYLGLEKRFSIIANGVPQTVASKAIRQSVRTELNCAPEDFLFLAVGNPRPEKGFEDLLDAMAVLHAQDGEGKSIRAVIAGTLNESEYCQMLLDQIEKKQLGGSCKFLGFREDTSALYAAADAFVLSSRSEGLPMVILEAMMAGVPVVSTNVGGISAAVGEHVLLVEAQQPSQLAEAMRRLAQEPNLQHRLAESGRRHVELNFGVERMIDEYVEWYRVNA